MVGVMARRLHLCVASSDKVGVLKLCALSRSKLAMLARASLLSQDPDGFYRRVTSVVNPSPVLSAPMLAPLLQRCFEGVTQADKDDPPPPPPTIGKQVRSAATPADHNHTIQKCLVMHLSKLMTGETI